MKVLKLFKSLFIFELKRRFRLREIILFLLILSIFGYFVNDGVEIYHDILENKTLFQQVEKDKIKYYKDYTVYGFYGISIFFVPSPFSIYSTEQGIDELLSNVNTGERLEFSKNLKGRAYFKEKKGLMNLRGVTLLFIIFFSLLYGCDTTGKRTFLKYLSSLAKPGTLFFVMAFVRMLLLIVAFMVIYGCSFLYLLSQGINLFQPPLLTICLVSILLIGVFYSMGCIIGSFNSKVIVGIVFAFVYFFSIFLIPDITEKHIRATAYEIESLYRFYAKNLELLMEAEKRAALKIGIYKENGEMAPDKVLKEVKEILNNEFSVVFASEEKMIGDMSEKIKYRQVLSCFFPVLFYNTTVEELSSCGGKSFIDFYKFCKDLKKGLLNFYVEKKFLGKAKKEKNASLIVESFVKGNENLYYARSQLPDKFGFGMGVMFLYIAIFVAVAYYRFKKGLHPVPPKGVMNGVDIDMTEGEEIYVKTCDSLFSDYFRAVLAGKTDQETVKINNRAVKRGEGAAFTYLCRPEDIPPEVKTNSLLHLLAAIIPGSREIVRALKEELGREYLGNKFADLPTGKQVNLLLLPALAANTPLYLVYGLADRCDKEASLEYEQKIRELLNKGGMAIYLSDAVYPNPNVKADRFYVVTRENAAYETREIK